MATAGPQRRCRVCRTAGAKRAFTRWTVAEGRLARDMRQTAPGRGYYSCSEHCAEILPKTIKGLVRT